MSNELGYLTKDEIINLYELFFGNILIKKKDFNYYSNLVKSLKNENSISNIIDKLDENELKILKILSNFTLIPYSFINEKLNIILKIPVHIINKTLSNLIDKKYIFLREDMLVIPHIYFNSLETKFEYSKAYLETDPPVKFVSVLNNIINFFISKQFSFSTTNTLYKKDLKSMHDTFSKHLNYSEDEYNIFSYFYANTFYSDDSLSINLIKEFFSLSLANRILYFLKIVFPFLYPLFLISLKLKTSISINMHEFNELLSYLFLTIKYEYVPFNMNFNDIIKFLKENDLIKVENDLIIFSYYLFQELNQEKNEIRISSSFNIYMNSNSIREDFYFPALFSEFIKYEKILEYEITEDSIKKAVHYGITVDDIFNYFNSINITVSKNVETTIKQWFDKHGSYFFAKGIIFYCQTKEKGKFINSLVNKGLIKAYEIKIDEIFIIPDEEQDIFFKFLENSGINYCEKKPINKINKFESIEINIKNILDKLTLNNK